MQSEPVPWWAVLSSASAPVLLIGGWQLAATRQLGGFNPVTQTISALASRGATDPWFMTTALVGVGVCHIITAAGLTPVALPGRLLLATGGAATVVLAGFPLPATGESPVHVAAASVAFSTLSLWPVFAGRRHGPPGPGISRIAGSVLLGLLGWFGLEFVTEGPRIGLSERFLAGAQALWPLVAVLLARRR
ncbi:MAG: DUF998 domain-containing protein [Pseudonocardiaceae bacterium]